MRKLILILIILITLCFQSCGDIKPRPGWVEKTEAVTYKGGITSGDTIWINGDNIFKDIDKVNSSPVVFITTQKVGKLQWEVSAITTDNRTGRPLIIIQK